MTGVSARFESSRLSPAVIALALLVGLGTVGLLANDYSKLAVAGIVALAAVAFFLAGEPLEKSLLLTIVAACLLPFEGFRRGLKYEEVMPLIALFFFLVVPRAKSATPRPITSTERWALLLCAAAGIGLLVGLASGHDRARAIDEFGLFLDFGLVLLVVRSDLNERWIKYLLLSIIGCTLVVSFRYLGIFAAGAGRERAATDQQHLLNLAIPMLFAFLFLARDWWHRVLAIVLLMPMLAATYVTLTRAIWIYVPFSVVLLVALLVIHHHVRTRLVTALASALVVGALAIGGYRLFTGQLAGGHEAIAWRAGTMRNLVQDPSLALRVDVGFQALGRFGSSPVWGTGLADHVRYRVLPIPGGIYLMDLSYVWVLWRLGVLGMISFLGLYFIFMKRVWFVYRHTGDDFQRWTAAGVFVSFVALLLIGLESGILVIYRFNLVWAALMGIFELWTQRIQALAPSAGAASQP